MMEPISTFIIAAACITVAPTTQRTYLRPDNSSGRVAELLRSSTTFLLPTVNSSGSAIETSVLVIDQPPVAQISPRELLMREVVLYGNFEDNWNGLDTRAPTRLALESALRFVENIPAWLPLPRPMLTSAGEIEFYWDLANGYAEVSFEEDGRAAFFSRAMDGVENFGEGIAVGDIDANWLRTFLAPIQEQLRRAA